jgi:hypothetical protein
MANTATTQISARLEKSTYKELKKRLAEDKISLQEFVNATVHSYIDDKFKMKKIVELEINPADDLHLKLLKGEGYEANGVDDLMDQLKGRKKPKPIKK